MRDLEAAHCSHAYLDKALVITGEAIVAADKTLGGGAGLSTK